MARVPGRYKQAVHVGVEINEKVLVASITVPAGACEMDLGGTVWVAEAQNRIHVLELSKHDIDMRMLVGRWKRCARGACWLG